MIIRYALENRVLRSVVFAVLLNFSLVQLGNAQSFELNEAQQLIYSTAHFELAPPGTDILYRLVSIKSDKHTSDSVALKVVSTDQDQRHQIELEFLTGDSRIDFPVFHGIRGNPIIIAFWERDVQEMSTITGGGQLYFRNRIRHALADNPSVLDTTISYNEKLIDAVKIEFKPYVNAPLRERLSYYVDKIYSVTLSRDLPGYVASLETIVVQDSDIIRETLSLDGVATH